MKLISNEGALLESNDKSIILTTHRIRQENKQWGKLQLKSIMLQDVSSCEYARKSQPIYLVLGSACLIIGVLATVSNNHDEIPLLIIAFAVLMLILYSLTSRKGLFISSSSSKISVNTKGMKDDQIKDFIDKLEEAKNNIK